MEKRAAQERTVSNGGLVWHYTSVDTLSLILQTNCFLATEVSFQNDIRETETADGAFEHALYAMQSEPRFERFASNSLSFLADLNGRAIPRTRTTDARFILCASEAPDSLYAWRTYGSKTSFGCAIGLDPNAPLGIVDPTSGPQSASGSDTLNWRRVVYDREDCVAVATEQLTELAVEWNALRDSGEQHDFDYAFGLLVGEIQRLRSDLRAVAKDPSFSDEQERRITYDGAVGTEMLSTTPSPMGPRPHVKVAPAERWGTSVPSIEAAGRLPIRAVRVGPDAPKSAEASVEWALLAQGYPLEPTPFEHHAGESWADTVLVSRSRHPYRAA